MKSVLISYILFLVFGTSAYSQSYTFRSLSGTDGLSDLVIGALYKDSRGYVWIGTATSVERFDGVHLKHYPMYVSSERWKWVNTFIETSGNQIWAGTDGGFWQMGQDRVERIAPDVIKNGVRSIVKDSKDTLYIGSETGLHIYKDGVIETLLLDDNAFSTANFIIGLYLDKDRLLWAVTKNGLYSMNMKDRKITHYPNDLVEKETDFSYRNITCIDSTLYIGTMEHGILSFDISTHRFNRYIDVGCNAIRALSCDGKDVLYVGTDGNGVCFISTKQKKIIRSIRNEADKEGGLRSNSVYSLLVDRDGLIWVGLCQVGLDYTVYQNELFSVYSTPCFTSKDIPVRTLYISENDKLIGSRNGLFYIDEHNGSVTKFQPPHLRSNIVTCCYALQGKIYIGTYAGGMYVFDLQTKQISDFEPDRQMPFVNGHIFCLAADKDDNLWIGTSSGIYCYKDGKMLKHFSNENSQLPDGNIYVICFDSTHKGWICTENGICIWDPLTDSIKTNIFPEGFVNKEKICGMYEDSEHNLYFLPYKGSIFISDLSLSTFRSIPPNTPLEGKDAMFMIEDKEGWLWIGTNNGLYRFDKKETFVPFSFADGIPSPIFLACTPVIDEEGVIWFGNSKGMLRLSADWKLKANKQNYKMRFSAVCTNGQQTSASIIESGNGEYEISLSTSQNNVTVCFSGFTFTDPAYMSYEYQMEGVDKDWQVLTGKSEVTYYDLSSGKYAFKVRQMGKPDSEVCLRIYMFSSVGYMWIGMSFVALMLLSVGFYVWRKKTKHVTAARFLHEPEENRMADKREEGDVLMEEKYKTSNLSVDECKRLTERLKKVMREEKTYTNPDLKIADLASIIGISSYSMSYLFNQYLKRNYYDYINDYRIAEFKCLVNKGEHTKYTLNALMELCGFSSRTSFFRCFKKVNGITPSEYIKSLESLKK